MGLGGSETAILVMARSGSRLERPARRILANHTQQRTGKDGVAPDFYAQGTHIYLQLSHTCSASLKLLAASTRSEHLA